MKNIFEIILRFLWFALQASMLLLGFSSLSISASIDVRSETFIKSFERETLSGKTESVSPVYAYLQLDAHQLSSSKLSFYAYGWGRYDASDSSFYDDQTDGELIYGYLEYADSYQGRSFRLGRQHVFEGVANESIDGLRLTSDLGEQFSVSVYGGLPVGLADTSGRSGDSIWGGRLAHRLGVYSNIGLSYKTIDNDDLTASSRLGIDSAFFLPMNVSLYGNSVRNMETEGWAEHSYELRFNVGAISIRPHYEMFEYDDYFEAGALTTGPFISLINSGEQLETLGLDLSWRQSQSWNYGIKTKHYSYDLNRSSQYLALSASWFGEMTTQVGGEVGYMQGDAADNDYVLIRFFCYLDQLAQTLWVDFVSGDILYTLYDQDIYGQSYAYFASLGGGRKFLNDDLELKLSADYSEDPYFENDLRSMLTVAYRFGLGF